MEKLVKELSQIGTVEVISKKSVFLLLMTGKGLTKMYNANKIQQLILDEVGEEYPYIEIVKTEDEFVLYCLKK